MQLSSQEPGDDYRSGKDLSTNAAACDLLAPPVYVSPSKDPHSCMCVISWLHAGNGIATDGHMNNMSTA